MSRRIIMSSGATAGTAVDNYAYLFTAVTSKHIITPIQPNFVNSFKMKFKFKLNSTTNDNNFYGLNGSSSIHCFVNDSNDQIFVKFGSTEGQNQLTLNWAKDTNWHDFQIEWTGKIAGAQGNITVLLDGNTLPLTSGGGAVSLNTPLTNINDNAFQTYPLVLGVRGSTTPGSFQNPLDGFLADFEYWQGTAAGTTPALVFRYNAEEQTGSYAIDSSGNQRHGTIVGAIHAQVTGTGALPTNAANDLGYALSDGINMYFDAGATQVIPVGVYIPRDDSDVTNSVAYFIGGDKVPLSTAGSGGGDGGGDGGSTVGDIYVATNGLVGNDGSINNPVTFARALQLANAGKTVLIRGGEYNMSLASVGQFQPQFSGTSGQRIVFKNYAAEVPVFTNCGSGAVAIPLSGRNYIDIEGITFNGKGIYDASNIGAWADLSNSTYNRFINCKFKYAKGYYGFSFNTGANYNIVRGCTFDYCGSLSKATSTAGKDPNTLKFSAYMHINDTSPDSGDSMWIAGGKYNLIENNTFMHGGHNNLTVDGSFNVVRNNIFDADWNFHRATGSQKISSRAAAFTGRQNKNQSGGGTGVDKAGQYNVFENNIFKREYWFTDNPAPMNVKLRGYRQIFRFNVIFEAYGDGISLTTSTDELHASGMKIYNNVITNCRWSPLFGRFTASHGSMKDNVFLNNLLYNNDSDNTEWDGAAAGNKYDLSITNGGAPTSQCGTNYFIGNCAFNKGRGERLLLQGYAAAGTFASYESNETTAPFVSNNIAADPKLVTWPETANDIETFGGNLVSTTQVRIDPTSPCKNAAQPMTRAVGGATSNILVVGDSTFFTDGMGVPDVLPDMIKIGSQTPVSILAINHSTNTITLASSRTWSNNDPVVLVFNNKTTVNIGVDQS